MVVVGPRDDTPITRQVLAVANQQYGVIAHPQLRRLGLTQGAIKARLSDGRLTRVFHRVYAVGHSVLVRRGWWLAALWACGRATSLSHLTAASYSGWGTEADLDVHVSTTRNVTSRPGDGARPGIVVHRVRQLDRVDVWTPGPFVVTHTPRTIVDCADVLAYPELRRHVDQCRSFRPDAVRAAQARAPGRPGRGLVARLLEADEAHTRSELERRFLRFLRAPGLPRPEGLNERVAGMLADAVYPGLVVELDGRAWHARRDQARTDHLRDERYQAAGYRIIRLLWDDFHPDEAAATAARLVRMLTA